MENRKIRCRYLIVSSDKTSAPMDLARWAWRRRRVIIGASVVAGGAYAAYLVYKKKQEFDQLCQELLGAASGGPDLGKEAR